MITEPRDFDLASVRDVVLREWAVTLPEVSFMPVGGDSWSYRAGELFVNVREAFGQRKPWSFPREVEPSLVAATVLKERCALDFLLTPMQTRAGRPLGRLGRYAITLFPYVDGSPSYDDSAEVTCDEETISWIDRLHAATPVISDVELPSEDFRPDFAATLREILDRGPVEGPYAERARELLASSRALVLETLARHETHGDALRYADLDFVVTHGEPAGNVLLARDGRRFLVDLVELKRGPRERDLHDYPPQAWDPSVDGEIVTYYKRGFALSEVTEYGDRLTRPHAGDAEDDRAWRYLEEYTDELRRY